MNLKKALSKNTVNPKSLFGIFLDFFKNNFLSLGLIIGFSIRIVLLFRPEQYWFDEVLSTYISRYNESIGNLIRFLQIGEYHPPLYYIIMFYWTRIFGIAEIATRSFSLIFGLATLPLFYAFSRKLFSKKVSELALFFLAINALHIEYSIEARPYTFFTFIGLLSAYVFVLLIKNRSRLLWLWFILLNIMGLYIHYSYSFIFASFIAFQIYSLFSKRIDKNYKFSLKEITFVISLVALGFLPWIPSLINRYVDFTQGIDFHPTQSLLQNLDKDFILIRKSVFDLFWLSKFPIFGIYSFSIATGKVLVILFLFQFVKTFKKANLWKIVFLSLMLLVPVTAFILSGYFIKYTNYLSKHVLFSVFPLSLIISFSLVSYKQGVLRVVFPLLFIVSLITVLVQLSVSDSVFDRDHRVKEIAEYIENNEKQRDIVLIDHHIFPVVFSHYFEGDSTIKTYFPSIDSAERVYLSKGGIDSLKGRFMLHTQLVNENNYQELSTRVKDTNRVWLLQVSRNPYFIKYLIENNWVISESSKIPYSFPVYFFEKN